MLNIRTNSRKKTISILTLLVIVALSTTACGKTKDTETLISEAKQYQQSGDNNAAIIQLKNALQQEPNNREARFLIGVSYNETGDVFSAEKELNRAIDLGMDNDQVIPILGEALLKIGEFQQLLDKTNDFPDINNSINMLILRGKAQLALGMHEDAKKLFEQALRIEADSPEALIGLSRYSLTKNDIDTAMRFAVQATRKNPTNTDSWLFLGDLLRAQGKIEQSLEAYNRVVKLDPKNTTALINRATIQINTREFEAAKSSLDSVKAISPNLINLFYTQALLEFNQENYPDALVSIQQVLRPAPNHMPSVLLAGAIQHALGSLVQAEDYLNQYIEVVPNNLYAIKLMATVLLKNKHAQESIGVIAPALKVIDQDPQLFALAGEAYMQTGDFAKANEFFEKANNLVPDNAAIHTAIGISKLAQGDNIDAINELNVAINLEGDSTRAGTLLVMTHLRLQEFDKALQVAETLERAEPDNPLFHNLKGGVYLGMKDNANARDTFNKALSLQADYFPAISNLARLDLHDNKPEAARKRFETFLAKDSKNIPAMDALANLALNQQDIDSATKWLELASSRNPNEVQPAIKLAAHYLRLGEKDKPLKISQKLMGMYPDDPRVLDILAQSLLANGRQSAALENYEKIAARLPDSAVAQFKIASIHASQENLPAASNALNAALRINPNYLEAKLAQIRIAVHNKNESEALSLAKNIQKQHKESPIGFVIEGDLLIRNQPAIALEAYEKAFTIAQNTPLLIKIHAALSQSGKENEANARLTKWLTDNPTDAQTRLYRAGLYLAKQQSDAAIKDYEVIIQQHPEHTISLNNLAWLYQQNKDSRAVEYAEKAYQQAPEAPAILDTLGWILFENGDLSRALSILQKASSLAPDANEIQYHFAAALAKSGDKTKAKGILEKILASDKTFTQIEEAKNLLTQLQ